LIDTANIKQPLQATKSTCTSLRHDSTGGQFIYDWKTPKGAGSCYKVTVMAQNGSTISACFELK
jgi:hypothetical protein